VPRGRYSLPHILGYHGCDRATGEAVLAGRTQLKPSTQDYDWLGNGIYFWVDSPERAWDWANHHPSPAKIREPFVLGALIYPGLCLNLTDYGVIDELRAAHGVLNAARAHVNARSPKRKSAKTTKTARPMPKNTGMRDGIFALRRLDCAVIETLHELRKEQGEEAYETVYGVFDEGPPAFSGAGFKEKTHIQLAVRNPNVIVGYFRVDPRGFI
jgi:hypothetical protein